MSYHNPYNPYSPPSIYGTYGQNFMQQTLGSIVEKGMPLMTNDLTEAMFMTWLEFSKEMLQLATKDTVTSTYINYLQLIITLHSSRLTPYQKLYYCLQYLLEVLKTV